MLKYEIKIRRKLWYYDSCFWGILFILENIQMLKVVDLQPENSWRYHAKNYSSLTKAHYVFENNYQRNLFVNNNDLEYYWITVWSRNTSSESVFTMGWPWNHKVWTTLNESNGRKSHFDSFLAPKNKSKFCTKMVKLLPISVGGQMTDVTPPTEKDCLLDPTHFVLTIVFDET